MRIGLSTPVVVQLPGHRSDWEERATVEDLARVAAAADALGLDHLTCSEHVAVPVETAATRGATYWDPLATLSFLAARTTRIRLATSVLVLGYHHPLALAKRYGTLDRLSGGRVVLGVGVGSLEQEFALLDAVWDDRGRRADDTLRSLRAAWGRPEVDGLVIEPHATSTHVPVWVGGRTARSLRRAVELGDGWMPFGLSPDELGALLARVELPPGFEVVLGPGRPLDPLGNPDRARRRLIALRDVGATVASCAVRADSVDHCCDQLGALRDLADEIGD
ncbi:MULTISPECIES: TIGR03619 family F420-dependent LLM class oxidoreductase [unclassified Nocardioides]|uniref:TIGR03619 family F420-dependent LLM class oxidoreductase n=1 Tax=unclassified Nocardioides TaxID=2615069 RepID=UPI0030148881